MTEAAQIGPKNAAAGAASREPAKAESRNKLSADFETFLKLLTTQLKAQDPLQPMESTEFVGQLASFSGVEQQVETNAKLDAVVEALGRSDAGALADWLGREVRAEAAAPWRDAPVTAFPPPPPEGTKEAVLVARDASGAAVAEIPFAPGESEVVWDGRLRGGGRAEAGALHRFEARYANGADASETAPAAQWTRVVEARRGAEGVVLRLEGGDETAAEGVSTVRAAATD
jgi:flagellar basal-body rod modification protein FlgD